LAESFERLIRVLKGYESLSKPFENGGDPSDAIRSVQQPRQSVDLDFLLAELPAAL
jgi:hypothetical protein